MKTLIALVSALPLIAAANQDLQHTRGGLCAGQAPNKRAIMFGQSTYDRLPDDPTVETPRTDRMSKLTRRRIFEIDSSCSKSQQKKVTQGAEEAVLLAESTGSLKDGSAPFSDFFLPEDLRSVNSVFTRAKKALGSNSVQLYISCSTSGACARPGVVGHADYTQSKVTFCPEYFKQPSLHDVDRSSHISYWRNIGQSWLHEAVHVLGGSSHITDVDNGYGYRNCLRLKEGAAKRASKEKSGNGSDKEKGKGKIPDKEKAAKLGPVKNADSYAWFATASYFKSK